MSKRRSSSRRFSYNKMIKTLVDTQFPENRVVNKRSLHVNPFLIHAAQTAGGFETGRAKNVFAFKQEPWNTLDYDDQSSAGQGMVNGGTLTHGSFPRLLATLRASQQVENISSLKDTYVWWERSTTITEIMNIANYTCSFTIYELQGQESNTYDVNPLELLASDMLDTDIVPTGVTNVSTSAEISGSTTQNILDGKITLMSYQASSVSYKKVMKNPNGNLYKLFNLMKITVIVLKPGEKYQYFQKSSWGNLLLQDKVGKLNSLYRPLLIAVDPPMLAGTPIGDASTSGDRAGYPQPNFVLTVSTSDILRPSVAQRKPEIINLLPPVTGTAYNDREFTPFLASGGITAGGFSSNLSYIGEANDDAIKTET